MEVSLVIAVVGLIVFLAHLFAVLFDRTRIPDVLPLMVLGLLLGPGLGLVGPEDFGRVGDVFTTIALVVILFESGLGLNFTHLKRSMLAGMRLMLVSFVITVALVSLMAMLVLRFETVEALILGAIVGATSEAVVIPMVAKLTLSGNTRTTLILESSFGVVLSIVVALGLMQAVRFRMMQPGAMLGQMLAAFLLAAAIGAAASLFWSRVLSHIRKLENSAFTTLAFVFIIFGVAEFLGYSGAIAALAFGIILGNIKKIQIPFIESLYMPLFERGGEETQSAYLTRGERLFFAEVVFLIKTFFFVYIGLMIHLTALGLVLVGLAVTILLFVLRLPAVWLSLERSVTRFDASIAAVMVPRGLATAVLASLAVHEGLARGTVIQDVVYAVILFSVVLTSAMIFLIERRIVTQPYGAVFAGFAADKSDRD